MIESDGEGIRSGGRAGNEGVWCMTGPVKVWLHFGVSTSMSSPKGKGFSCLLSRRCQMKTPRVSSRMLMSAQAAIPPIAPMLSLQ